MLYHINVLTVLTEVYLSLDGVQNKMKTNIIYLLLVHTT